ncbi:hexokinase type 2-like [Adelges cooleyi]|uniref:hexokinase type 2-like n=1 Tax=Adelges cooleyi TaxID=133065 RepID=UPI00217F5461|nr:hexokinase type 2-like [Adelges cooleyi]
MKFFDDALGWMNRLCTPRVSSLDALRSTVLVPNSKLRELSRRMASCIEDGLGKDTHARATVKCFQTYVQDMPTGLERGTYLALDLGGSNFRVLKGELGINKYFYMEQETYSCSQDLMTGSGEHLFDHIAECLKKFIDAQGLNDGAEGTPPAKSKSKNRSLPVGFTFSFPMSQRSVDSGVLTRWTKGFTCDGVVDNDVVELLRRSIAKHAGLSVRICAILNDTVGTLMACAWKDPKTKLGLIVGTGSNCCYVEKVDAIGLYVGDPDKEQMIINLEWGSFGDNGELEGFLTKYDQEVDANSVNPRQQLFEKMVSGMYLGEIFRLLLVDMAKANLIFDGRIPEALRRRRGITTDVISNVERDPPGSYGNARECLKKFGIEATDRDLEVIRNVAECVSKRSARMVAAGLVAILNRIDEPEITIGVDGSVYRHHPHYHNILVETINELLENKKKINVILSEDGSGRGAAVVAAAVCKSNR